MAGVLKVQTIVKCTGLDEEFTIDTGEVTMTVPVEHGGKGKYIIHDTAGTTAIQVCDPTSAVISLFPHIALAKMYGVYIKAVSGTIYVKLDTSGTTTFDETTAHLVLNEGEAQFLQLQKSGEDANNAGIAIDAASTDDAFTITVFGSA